MTKSSNLSLKYDQRLLELNKILIEGIKEIKQDNYIFKLSSGTKNVLQSNFQPRDLINLTLRINNNYIAPVNSNGFLPAAYLDPYPAEEREMKHTFLKFNFDESQRIKSPTLKPMGGDS